MRQQEEIVELRVHDFAVDNGASGTIARAIGIATFGGEETCVVTFRNDDKGDVGAVAFFEGLARGTDGFDFGVDDVRELTFGDTVTEEQHAFGFGFGLLVEGLVELASDEMDNITLNNSTVMASRSEMISTRGP